MARSTNQRRRTHHRPRPPRQAQRTSTAQGTRNQGTRAWRGGVGSPRSGRWGNGTPNANAAAPKSNGNSAPKLGRASHSLLGADRGRIEPLLRANANPKRRRAAPFGATTLKGRIRGLSSHEPPKGAAGLGSFLSLVGESREPARREWDEPPASQPDPNARHNKQPFYTPPMTPDRNHGRAYRGECRRAIKGSTLRAESRESQNGVGGRGAIR